MPEFLSTRVTRLLQVISLPFIIIVVMFPYTVYTHTVTTYHAVTIFSIIWVVHGLVRALWQEKKLISALAMCGFTALMATTLHDIIRAQYLIRSDYIVHYGLFGFIVCNSCIIGIANERSRRTAEYLSGNLEIEVREKTRVIQNNLEELEKVNRKLTVAHDALWDELELAKNIRRTSINRENEERLKKVILYINENYSDDFNREELAIMFNMHPDYLGRLFKKYTGKKLGDYINEIRIDKSLDMLKNTTDTITDIAYSAGFESYRTYSRIFVKLMKMTPQDYRKT